jgi:hypothetical protein
MEMTVTMTEKYSFDDHPAHRAQLDAWRDKSVIDHTASTARTSDGETASSHASYASQSVN